MRRSLVLITVCLALAGCGSIGQVPHRVVDAPSSASGSAASSVAPARPRVKPVAIDVPRIGASSSLVPLGLAPDGSLATPDVHHPEQAGYYCVIDIEKVCSAGVLPGQPGPAVVAGHVDGDHKPGVFHRLNDLKVGDTATVKEADGSVLTFGVYRVLHAAKTEFPSQVVYGDTVGPELRLITCSGSFVGGRLGYSDNTIVFMSMIPNPA